LLRPVVSEQSCEEDRVVWAADRSGAVEPDQFPGDAVRFREYLPDDRPGKHPTIVMAHGFSAVKEMYLDKYAEAFAHAGFASVVYDNRN
jgi:predicted alpha/beta-fold hydrolase